jgi:phosphate starvation-inducible membrane PsiE
MDAAEILVIILSITLAMLLVLSIVLVAYLIKIARQIKRITATAERAADKFDTVANIVQRAAGPAVITKLVGDIISRFTDKKR